MSKSEVEIPSFLPEYLKEDYIALTSKHLFGNLVPYNFPLPEKRKGHRKKMFTEIQILEIKKLYSEGVSKNKIAKIFHCNEKTIRNYLK